MISRTLAQLRVKARARADMTNSAFVSDSEVNDALNQAGHALVKLLVQAYGEDYFSTEYTFSTVAGQFVYEELPDDFYQLLGITANVNADRDIPLQRGTPEDMRRSTLEPLSWLYGCQLFYALRGRTIRLAPTPTAAHTVTLRYISSLLFFDTTNDPIIEMTVDTDYAEFEDLQWERFVVLQGAIDLMRKEEGNTADLERDLATTASQIISSVRARDQANAPRIRMVMA